ncbi:hypothetical protein [Conexibacter sp. DBS9H8]|uniref:hypothetical protein n=1 Tax=Conexibacter sp. DBS9H8 TaxID=2937801 RepID=UPI0035312451
MTTVERALLDAAGALPARTLARALDEAVAARWTSRTKLRELLDRVSPCPAVRLLAQLADPGRPSGLTESRLAERALALIAAAQLPAPHTEVELFGYRADAYWPEAALVLEIDSFGFHGLMRENFNRDRLKDRTLGRHGIAVVRWSEDDVARRGLEIIAALATTIARRHDGRPRDSPHTRPPTPGYAPRSAAAR